MGHSAIKHQVEITLSDRNFPIYRVLSQQWRKFALSGYYSSTIIMSSRVDFFLSFYANSSQLVCWNVFNLSWEIGRSTTFNCFAKCSVKYSERPATTMVLKLPFNRGNAQSIEETLSKLSDEKLLGDFDEIFKIVPVTNDTSCGIGICRGPTLQK